MRNMWLIVLVLAAVALASGLACKKSEEPSPEVFPDRKPGELTVDGARVALAQLAEAMPDSPLKEQLLDVKTARPQKLGPTLLGLGPFSCDLDKRIFRAQVAAPPQFDTYEGGFAPA